MHMQRQLSELVMRLNAQGAETMAAIYNLTSSHIYGVIFNILLDDADASAVMKAVYARLWKERDEISAKNSDPLMWLRATAHRLALDFKYSEGASVNDLLSSPKVTAIISGATEIEDLDDSDKALLQRAYINASSLSEFAKKEGLSETAISKRLRKILTIVRVTS